MKPEAEIREISESEQSKNKNPQKSQLLLQNSCHATLLVGVMLLLLEFHNYTSLLLWAGTPA